MSEQLAQYRADHDAMGHELLDGLEDKEATEIIEREDGHIDCAPALRYFSPYEEWYPFEKQAIASLTPGRVLDLGCGAGRVALYLQEQGVEVVGIDNSPLAIEVCRRRGVRDARLLSVTQVGPQLGHFDNIVMFGNNWGLMGSFRRARWLLRRFKAITSPQARIIANSNDVYTTTNPLHLAYQAWNRARGRMSGQIRFRVRHGIHASNWFDYLMVSKEEMQQILQGTGWKVERFIDSEGSTYFAVIVKEK
jgi:SAM-dependent methyltransferase